MNSTRRLNSVRRGESIRNLRKIIKMNRCPFCNQYFNRCDAITYYTRDYPFL